MRRLDDWPKIAAIVAVAGLIAYGPQRVPPAGTRAELAAGSTLAVPPATTAEQLIAEYLGDRPGGPLQTAAERRMLRDRALAQFDVRFVVALLPDPVDSDARWMFDSLLDALHSAAAQQGYSLFRYSLPDWQPATAGGPTQARSSRSHELEPGIILLHQPAAADGNGRPRLLALLLAYETPTAGAHATALSEALRLAYQWQECRAEPLKIVGPTFSGSAPGLRTAFDRFSAEVAAGSKRHPWLDGCPADVTPLAPTFQIVTGSATSSGNRGRLTVAGRMTFDSAVLSDEDVLASLLQFIDSRYPTGGAKIALLIESTPYGDALSAARARDLARIDKYRFPLHISRLRSSTSETASDAGRRARMPIELGDRLEPTDRLPAVTPSTTAPAVDLMLASIFDQIRRARVDAIGLFATDTRDKLFLAREIARNVPGVLLFTTEADVLYTHPSYRAALRGTIVASTYPLIPTDEVRSRRTGTDASSTDSSKYLFPSSSALGLFNAAMTLLDSNADLLEYRQDDTMKQPPVWISVVARGGIWPVQTTAIANQSYSMLDDAHARMPYVPGASVWTWIVTLALAGLALFHLATEFGVFARWRLAPVQEFRHLAVACSSLLAILALYTWMWRAGPGGSEQIGAVIVLAGATICCGATLVHAAYRRPPSLRLSRSLLPAALGVVGALAMVIYLDGYFEARASEQLQQGLLLFDRASHPIGGASPVAALAIVIAPMYLWSLVRMFAVDRAAHRGLAAAVYSNGGTIGRIPPAPTRTRLDWIAKYVGAWQRPIETMPFATIAVVVAGVVLTGVVFAGQRVVSVEPAAFTMAFLLAWLLAQLLLSLTLADALRTWSLFRELLSHLALHPLVVAYSRIPEHMLGDRLSPRRPRVADLGPLVNTRTALAAPLPPLAKPQGSYCRDEVTRVIVRLKEAPVPFERDFSEYEGEWSSSESFQQLIRDAAEVREALRAWWRREAPPDDEALAAWYRRAEEFLGLFLVLFVRQTLSRLTTTLFFLVISVLLLVAAQAMFTFHPRQILLGATWCYVAAVVVVAMRVFIAIERDLVLSRLASTEEGRIVWDRSFLGKVVVYALIPIATLFAAQFPQLADTITRWLTPMQQALP